MEQALIPARKRASSSWRVSPEVGATGAELRLLTLSLKAIAPRPLECNRLRYF